MCQTQRRAAWAALLVMLAGASTTAHSHIENGAVRLGKRARAAQSSTPAPGTSSSSTVSAPTPGSQAAGAVDKVSVAGGTIRGRVRVAPTDTPMRNVRITMRGAPGVQDLATATTNDEGYFELSDVRPGDYRLLATRAGFVMSDKDRGSPDLISAGRPVVVGAAGVVDDVEFVLLPGAVIAGQILSAEGEPLVGAVVHVHREQFHDGKPWPHPDSAALDLTDDFGRFRVFGLSPGNYFVSARATTGPQISGPSGGALALGATFFPGTTVGGDGRVLQLRAGEEVDGIVFAVTRTPDPMPAGAGSAAAAPVVASRPDTTVRAATMRGRVIRQGDGAVVGGAEVLLRSASGARVVRTVPADAGGRFEIAGLEPGGYTLAAAKRGYASLQLGQRRPGDPAETIIVQQADVIDDLTLVLAGGSAVEGRVVDGRGEPVAGALVQVRRQQWVRGRQQLVTVPVAPDLSDDRGAFRIHSLAPSTYLLTATTPARVETPSSSWMTAGPGLTTMYPGSASVAAAQPITLGSAQEVGGLVITTPDARPVRVTGVVEDELGRRVRAPSVSLMQLSQLGSSESVQGTAAKADGSFEFTTVFPGEYTIAAASSQLGERVAYEQIVVTDVDLVVPLVLRRASTFSGRILFESEADRKSLVPQAVQVRFDPWEPNQLFRGSLTMLPRADWSFEVTGLVGLRRLHVALPSDWAVTSARIGNTDLLDVPVSFTGADISGAEIELTRRVTQVIGTAVDASGQPVPHAIVVLFAEDRRRREPESRFVTSVLADRFGRFGHRGLPAARYLAAAVNGLEPGEETNPAVLDRLHDMSPARFTLEEGEAQQDLQVPLLQ